MRQLPPLQQPADARSDPREDVWSASAWLESLHLHECVAATFCPDAAAPNQFEVMRKLSRDHIRARLASSILVRELTERIAAAAQALNLSFTNIHDPPSDCATTLPSASFDTSVPLLERLIARATEAAITEEPHDPVAFLARHFAPEAHARLVKLEAEVEALRSQLAAATRDLERTQLELDPTESSATTRPITENVGRDRGVTEAE